MSYKTDLIELQSAISGQLALDEVQQDAPAALSNSDLQRVAEKHKFLTRSWDTCVKAFGNTYKEEITARRVKVASA